MLVVVVGSTERGLILRPDQAPPVQFMAVDDCQ